MREDSSVEIALLCLLLFAFVQNAFFAFRPGVDDPMWEMRWRGLDGLDRAWITAAVLSRSSETRAALVERGEEELAKGCSRRERRRRAYIELATLPLLIFLVTLVLTGVLGSSNVGLVLGSYAMLQGLLYYLRERRIKKAYRVAQDAELALSRQGDAAPA